jgi:hypothetical protein
VLPPTRNPAVGRHHPTADTHPAKPVQSPALRGSRTCKPAAPNQVNSAASQRVLGGQHARRKPGSDPQPARLQRKHRPARRHQPPSQFPVNPSIPRPAANPRPTHSLGAASATPPRHPGKGDPGAHRVTERSLTRHLRGRPANHHKITFMLGHHQPHLNPYPRGPQLKWHPPVINTTPPQNCRSRTCRTGDAPRRTGLRTDLLPHKIKPHVGKPPLDLAKRPVWSKEKGPSTCVNGPSGRADRI